MALGGVMFTIAAHLVVPGLITGAVALLALGGHEPTRAIPEDKVVEAKFRQAWQALRSAQDPEPAKCR